MKRILVILPALGMVFLLLGGSSADLPRQPPSSVAWSGNGGSLQAVVSTFDADAEGWLVVGTGGGYGLPVSGGTNPYWYVDGGNPGGRISTDDQYGETFFSAPAKFLGDQSPAFGMDLQFDIVITYSDYATYPAVILEGAAKSLYYNAPSTVIGDWTTRTIPLVGSGWNLNGWQGAPATDADMQEVLGDLRGLYINGEWNTGPDWADLDNVSLEGADLCIDKDGDGYGDPADPACPQPERDCADDPSADPPICATCTCGNADCAPCAACIHPGAKEFLNDGIDSDCDGSAGRPNLQPVYDLLLLDS